MILEKPRKVFGLSRNGHRNDLTVAQVAFNMELYLGKEQLFSFEIRKSNGLCSRYCWTPRVRGVVWQSNGKKQTVSLKLLRYLNA